MRACLASLLFTALAAAALIAQAKPPSKGGAHGAIALASESGAHGYVFSAPSARAAKTEALKQCGDARCEVMLSFSNACGALVRGTKKYFTASGATRQEAEAKALRKCGGKECEVLVWACTR